MAEVGPRQAKVACTPQSQDADALRDRPLNPSTAGILSSIFRRICAFAPLFEGQIVLFGSHRNGPSDRFLLRLDALRTARARTADRGREFDLDDVCLPLVDRWGPTETGLPLRAGCLLLLPVNNKSLDIEALTCLGLPFHIWSRRTEQIHVVVLSARHQQFSVKIPRVHDVGRGEQPFLLKRVVYGWCNGAVSDGGRSRLDMRDEVWSLVVAGLSQMDLVANPGGRALARVVGVGIVGRRREN
jgi:hypothetical protein